MGHTQLIEDKPIQQPSYVNRLYGQEFHSSHARDWILIPYVTCSAQHPTFQWQHFKGLLLTSCLPSHPPAISPGPGANRPVIQGKPVHVGIDWEAEAAAAGKCFAHRVNTPSPTL